nr:protein YLS9 [Ipomoea batatas]
MQSNMAEKVYPSKPAFNGATTSPAANSGTNPPKKAQLYHATRPVYRPSSRRNRSCLCSCCLWTTFLVIILVFLAAVAGVIFWAVYRPHRPSFTVNSLSFSHFNISSSKLTSNFTSTISARNPNKKLTFFYDPITVSLFSGDVAVGTGSLPGAQSLAPQQNMEIEFKKRDLMSSILNCRLGSVGHINAPLDSEKQEERPSLAKLADIEKSSLETESRYCTSSGAEYLTVMVRLFEEGRSPQNSEGTLPDSWDQGCRIDADKDRRSGSRVRYAGY